MLLIWNDENESVCAAAADVTQEDFLEAAKAEAKEMAIVLPEDDCLEIDLIPMIAITETLYGDQVRPLAGSGIVIEDYWVLDLS